MSTSDNPCDSKEARQFDFFLGRWKVANTFYRPNGWEIAFRAKVTVTRHESGCGVVAYYEYKSPDRRISETITAVCLLDPEREVWSIDWNDSLQSEKERPLYGAFDRGVGEFYRDVYDSDGTMGQMRFTWRDVSLSSPRWERAYSFDYGATWQVDWTMRFKRSDVIDLLPAWIQLILFIGICLLIYWLVIRIW